MLHLLCKLLFACIARPSQADTSSKVICNLKWQLALRFVACALVSYRIGHCTNIHSLLQIHIVIARLVALETVSAVTGVDNREELSKVILVCCIRRKAAWCSHHLSGEKIHDTSS